MAMMNVTQFSCLALLFCAIVLFAGLRRAEANQIDGSDVEPDVREDKEWNSGSRVERSLDIDAEVEKLEIRLKQLNQDLNSKIEWANLTGALASAACDIDRATALANYNSVKIDLGAAKYNLDGENLLQAVLGHVTIQWGLQYKTVRINSDVADKSYRELKQLLSQIRRDYENGTEQNIIESFENISLLARDTMQILSENLAQFKKIHLMIREILTALPNSTETAEIVELMKNFTSELDLNVHTWGHMISMIQFVKISSNIASTYYTKNVSKKTKISKNSDGGRPKGGSEDDDKMQAKTFIFRSTIESHFVLLSSLGTLKHHIEDTKMRNLIEPLIEQIQNLIMGTNDMEQLCAATKAQAHRVENKWRPKIERNIPILVKKMRAVFANATHGK